MELMTGRYWLPQPVINTAADRAANPLTRAIVCAMMRATFICCREFPTSSKTRYKIAPKRGRLPKPCAGLIVNESAVQHPPIAGTVGYLQ